MSSEFAQHGRTLLANGYLIVPIKPGDKAPAIPDWVNARIRPDQVTQPVFANFGVGILTGQGDIPLAAIDIDTTLKPLAQGFVNWCTENLGLTCERVGKAPKLLLVYRAADTGYRKATGAWFTDKDNNKHRVEVLGHGQQFVAYHIHPDTKQPYKWVDVFGGIERFEASELPTITSDQIEIALKQFEVMAEKYGLKRGTASVVSIRAAAGAGSDPLEDFEPPIGLDIDDARLMLVGVDNEDYDSWLRVGMSLHHEYEGSDEAFELWDTWSEGASNYTGREALETRWQGFGTKGGRPVTIKWLVKLTNEQRRVAIKEEKLIALDEVKGLISNCTSSIDLINEIAPLAGSAAGTDLAIKVELQGLIKAQFKKLTGTALPIAELKTAMQSGYRAPVAEHRAKRALTEFGNLDRLLDKYGDSLMYVPETDAFYMWTGIYWRWSSIAEVTLLANEIIRALPNELEHIEGDAERANFLKFCAASQKAQMVKNMVVLAKSDVKTLTPIDELDKKRHLFGVGNGAVDLKTGNLLAPDPQQFITINTPVSYSPQSEAPLFLQTLSDVFFDDVELVEFFQRLVGYSITGNPKEDIIVIPFGDGSNGKSTILGAIREALGNHAKTASSDTFLSATGRGGNSGNGPREDVLRLRGSRFVYVTEPDEGSELREGLIKCMTGGESMPARGLYSVKTIEVEPTWVTFMPTNHRPIVKGDDNGIWRRLLPIPFVRNFELEESKDPARADKLRRELPGILKWCIEGAVKYNKQGLDTPKAVAEARKEYRVDMDILAGWLAESCELDANYSESNAALWQSWRDFSLMHGETRFLNSARALGRRLAVRFKPYRKAAERGFTGLRVKKSVI
jgi:P4 family phage/plasmid primase-like protien